MLSTFPFQFWSGGGGTTTATVSQPVRSSFSSSGAGYSNSAQRMDNQSAWQQAQMIDRLHLPNMSPTNVVSPNVEGATTAATSYGVGFNPNTGAPMPGGGEDGPPLSLSHPMGGRLPGAGPIDVGRGREAKFQR